MYARIEEEEMEAYEVSIDYLTCSWKRGEDTEGRMSGLMNLAIRATGDLRGGLQYAEQIPEHSLGYKGIRVGNIFVGEHEQQGILVRASGKSAMKMVIEIPDMPDNVSRLDVQLTVFCKTDKASIIQEIGHHASSYRFDTGCRPFGVAAINGFGSGDTCYLGSRKSDVFLRVYDKARESGGDAAWRNAIRYEAELKKAWSNRAYVALASNHWSPSKMLGVLSQTFAAKGVVLPVVRPSALPVRDTEEDWETEVERTLRWFTTQVSPSVAKLLTKGASRDQVMKALGLMIDDLSSE